MQVMLAWNDVITHDEHVCHSTVCTIHRHTRKTQTSYIAPCNGVISYGVQIGGLQVFVDHTCKSKRKTNVSMVFAHRAAFYACLSLRSD